MFTLFVCWLREWCICKY